MDNANHLNPNDHRVVAQRLDLFHFRDEAPGMVFWHPQGFHLYRLLEEAVRQVTAAQGYAEIRTPQVLRRAVWEASGHWQHFNQGMFHVMDQAVEAAIKPVSCPGHLLVAGRRTPSYRELPMRYAELGLVHRDEPGGTLHGLMRLRQFTQDDGHIFCASDVQAQAEVVRFCAALPAFYAAFGFPEVSIALSTRPTERAGGEEQWNRAEATLRAALAQMEVPYTVQEGAGAFYGPKIEYALKDRMGRAWQCGTIQMDLVMPQSFDLRHVDADGQRAPVLMLHRALYGSLERFLGIVLEQHGARLPLWMAPRQVVILPVATPQLPLAEQCRKQLNKLGIRCSVDSNETLAKRIAVAHAEAVPLQVIIGPRDAAAGNVTLRQGEQQEVMGRNQALDAVVHRCAPPDFAPGD